MPGVFDCHDHVTFSTVDLAAVLATPITRLIYEHGCAYLREQLHEFVAGRDPGRHLRACYPFVRITTDTVARCEPKRSTFPTRRSS